MPIDYSKYPPNWFTEIRPAVLERAGHRCEWCNAPNHALIYRPEKGKSDWRLWPEGMLSEALSLEGYKSTKVVPTIAHLDHDKENHEVSLARLAALCQRCHLKYDLPRHIRNRNTAEITMTNRLAFLRTWKVK